jgi:hypothetical protein
MFLIRIIRQWIISFCSEFLPHRLAMRMRGCRSRAVLVLNTVQLVGNAQRREVEGYQVSWQPMSK